MKTCFRNLFFAVISLSIILSFGCSGIPGILPTTDTGGGESTPTPTGAISTDSPENLTPTPITTEETDESVVLRIWTPPEFDPNSESPAGLLFKRRLDTFIQLNPGITIDVRVKALEGPGGLLDSLTTASAAAPLALPDLIALPRGQMEIAALKGLLSPYDGLTEIMDGSDWYPYARELAMIQNSVYGLPFAGDALSMVYRPVSIESPPTDWEALIESAKPLIFPAADPQALFSLLYYRAEGGAVYDEQERPFLDADVLTEILGFYAQAEQVNVMPTWLTQYQSDDQSWEAFLENRSDMVITWTSRYLKNSPENTSLAPAPTQSGNAYTLADGWVWALAASPNENRELIVSLAEFLVNSGFLANWTIALGYLPTRPSVLETWPTEQLQLEVRPVLLSAALVPENEILDSLGLPLQQAVIQVLQDGTDPVVAAQIAVASVVSP